MITRNADGEGLNPMAKENQYLSSDHLRDRTHLFSVQFKPSWVGWCPSTVGRIVCFTHSMNLNANVFLNTFMRVNEENQWMNTGGLKICTTWELQIKFYWGQDEHCSLGDGASDSSEKLLQRGGRGREDQYTYDFWWRGVHAIKHIFFQKVSVSLLKLSARHKE